MTLICSKLFCCSYNGKIFTVSNEYCALTWSDINLTIICVINVNIGSNIEDKILRLFTIINVVLLTFYWINLFYSKLIGLIFKTIIVRIVLFLYCSWFQYVRIWFFLFLFHWLNLRWFCLYGYLFKTVWFALKRLVLHKSWMTLNIFFRVKLIWLNSKRHTFLRDLFMLNLCFYFGLYIFLFLFFILFFINLLWLGNKWLSCLSLLMFSIVIKMNIFGNSWWVIIYIHTVNIFLHLKGFLMYIIRSFRIFSSLRT